MRRFGSVVVEADGGSRGNPGNAAYGALLKDAETGDLIAERGERIGVATNNVAEYRGLIAGLELYREYADGADLEVRMDSKLVVEQMSGRWKIKHPDMKPLAMQAHGLAPFGTTYTWVPRERNKHADRLANEALDRPEGVVVGRLPGESGLVEDALMAGDDPGPQDDPGAVSNALPGGRTVGSTVLPTPPWEQGPPTVLVLVRHGETDHTTARLFSGSAGGDPSLNDTGRGQVAATASWLAPLFPQPPRLISSPMRRTRESAAILTTHLADHHEGVEEVLDDGFVEASFGDWEGLTYADVLEREPDVFSAWLKDPARPAGRVGDSLTGMAARMRTVRDRMLEEHAGGVVLAVTHLTPIKMLVAEVLDLPLEGIFRTEVTPASVTVLAWYPDGRGVVRLLNGHPTGPSLGLGHSLR